MNRQQLVAQIQAKRSLLCVGLDSDIEKIPAHLMDLEDPVFEFNKAIIDATHEYAVAYKINTAFYEVNGLKGWESLERTLKYIPQGVFTIADAKRGDIGNTAEKYASTFFNTYGFHAVTVAPYMGKDSVQPFMQYPGKWAIVLGLTSNAGSHDFQLLRCNQTFLYQEVMQSVASWGTSSNTMFVVGATQVDQLAEIRSRFPDHFFLVPGIGAQGGDLQAVMEAALNIDGGLLINVSRALIFADGSPAFAMQAKAVAKAYQQTMEQYIK